MNITPLLGRYIAIIIALKLLTCAAMLKAQNSPPSINYIGFDKLINDAISNSFPSNSTVAGIADEVTNAIGSGSPGLSSPLGTATFTGLDLHSGAFFGPGTGGSVNLGGNINFGGSLKVGDVVNVTATTNITWTTSISWKTVEGADGWAHIEITVTWGNNTQGYSRTLDAKTMIPNQMYDPNAPKIPSDTSVPSDSSSSDSNDDSSTVYIMDPITVTAETAGDDNSDVPDGTVTIGDPVPDGTVTIGDPKVLGYDDPPADPPAEY